MDSNNPKRTINGGIKMEYRYYMTCVCGAKAGYNDISNSVGWVDVHRTLRARCTCETDNGGI